MSCFFYFVFGGLSYSFYDPAGVSYGDAMVGYRAGNDAPGSDGGSVADGYAG